MTELEKCARCGNKPDREWHGGYVCFNCEEMDRVKEHVEMNQFYIQRWNKEQKKIRAENLISQEEKEQDE